jgi:predicted metal-dependent peptidase
MINVEDKIAKAIKALVQNLPFYGLFMLSLNKVFSETFPSYGAVSLTNSMRINMIFNTKLCDTLTKRQLIFLVTHELNHITRNHLFMDKHFPNRVMANIAMDLAINSDILKDHSDIMDFIEGGVLPERYSLPNNKSSRWYYDELTKIQESINKKQQSQSQVNGGQGNFSDKEQNDSNLTQEEQNLKEDLMSPEERFEHNWEKQLEELSDLEKQMVQNNIQHTLKKTVEEHKLRSKGNIPAYMKDMIDNLFQIKPENFDWKAFYRRFLGVSVSTKRKPTRKRQSKRFPEFQGSKSKKQHRILYAVDTSGSMCAKDIEDAFSEVYHVWKAGAIVDVIECDTVINRVYEYKGKTPEFISGRGGKSCATLCSDT